MTEIGLAKCLINKITTTIDGGARITLDLGMNDKELISKLLSLKLSGDDQILCVFVESDKNSLENL